MSRRPSRHSRGFTLIEAIATMVVLGVMGAFISGLIVRVANQYSATAVAGRLQGQLSTAMERVFRELQSIPARAGASPVVAEISAVTASSVTFRTNWVLSLVDGQLLLAESGATAQPLLDDVIAFSVQALDAQGAALAASLSGAACDAVNRFSVTIAVTRAGVTETLRTRVFIRALQSGASG